MRRAFLWVVPLLLSGCVVGPSPSRVAFLNSLIGQDETTLVRTLGVPSRSFQTGGHSFLAYDEQRVEVIPGWQPWPYGPFAWGPGWGGGWGGGFPPQAVTYGCETTFELDGGRVASWNLRGDDC